MKIISLVFKGRIIFSFVEISDKRGGDDLKRVYTPYVLGFLFVLLIFLIVYILRHYTLADAEIGLIGAIIGGSISGGLTLIGVKATLDHQKDEKFLDLYPKRKMILDRQLDIMNEILKLYKDYSVMSREVYLRHYERLRNDFKKSLEDAVTINAEVYDITKAFLLHFENINECMGSEIVEMDENTQIPITIVTGVNADKEGEFNNYLEELENCYSEIKLKMNKFDNKYKKLTGV